MPPAALVLAFAISATAQARPLDAVPVTRSYPVEEGYEKIRDLTTLSCDLVGVHSGVKFNTKLKLDVFYRGKGRHALRPGEHVHLYFHGYSEDGWQYLKSHNVILLLDGETRYRFETKHDGDVETGYVTEDIWVNLTPAQFKRLSEAATVEGEIGTNEFKLNHNQVFALRDFADHVYDPTLPPEAKRPPTPEELRAQAMKERREAEEKAALDAKMSAELKIVRSKEAVAKAEAKLKLAQSLEKQGKVAGALSFYKEIVRDLSDTPAAKTARERLAALTKR